MEESKKKKWYAKIKNNFLRAVCYGEEAVAGGRLLCWRAEIAEAAAMPSGDAVPAMDGNGCKDSAEE